MIDQATIQDLFKRYGFQPGYSADPSSHIAFTIRSGYFHQAEVLVFDSNATESVSKTRSQLEASGFAISVRTFESYTNLESRLFSGFFGVEASRTRHRQHYDTFIEKLGRLVGGQYSYVAGPYCLDEAPYKGGSAVEAVLGQLANKQATLVLIEAAAGFGKTCTAYEVLAALLERQPEHPPLFIELARNRQAPLFRYVLLDEIDRNYPSLNSELVTYEIARGNVPLIIDGFDELLRRSIGDELQEQEHPRLESMLDTIAELLQGAAKIVLTTRRTAMFSASTFDAWTATHTGQFRSVRLSLQEPSIRDWLGAERAALIESLGTIAHALANPVLLTFLRNANDDQFRQYAEEPDALVDEYFKSLLEREMDRQNINLDHQDQLTIYRELASRMMANDIMAESRDIIAQMIREGSRGTLEESVRRYPAMSRPTLEELSERLAGHALLDRLGGSVEQVGFVNEFVAGTLFGEVLAAGKDILCSEKIIDLSTSAYRVRSAHDRETLYNATTSLRGALFPQERLAIALRLLRRMDEELIDETLDDYTFEDLSLGEPFRIANTVFVNCEFRNVRFHGGSISRCGFVHCKFYGCEVVAPCQVSWCTEGASFPDASMLNQLVAAQAGATRVANDDLELEVLRQFWPKGRSHASNRLSTRTVYRGFSTEDRQGVTEAIENLRRNGLLSQAGDAVILEIARIGEIRERLGR